MTLLTPTELQAAIDSKTYPRITEVQIDRRVKNVTYFQPTVTMILCTIELDNGYVVTGESACVDPGNFDPDIGKTIAHKRAKDKLWSLLGFLLAEQMYNAKQLAG